MGKIKDEIVKIVKKHPGISARDLAKKMGILATDNRYRGWVDILGEIGVLYVDRSTRNSYKLYTREQWDFSRPIEGPGTSN